VFSPPSSPESSLRTPVYTTWHILNQRLTLQFSNNLNTKIIENEISNYSYEIVITIHPDRIFFELKTMLSLCVHNIPNNITAIIDVVSSYRGLSYYNYTLHTYRYFISRYNNMDMSFYTV